MTTSSPPGVTGSGGVSGRWRRWTVSERTAVVGTVIAVAGVLVSILQWQWPKEPAADPGPAPPASANTGQPAGPATVPSVGPATGAVPPAGSATSGPAVDLAGLSPRIGGDKLVDIPLPVRERADYNSHAVAIRCPSNTSREPAIVVVYELARHYRQFEANVHPYYPRGVRSVTRVTALRGDVGRDGTLTTTEVTSQVQERPDPPQPLTAVVEKADQLALRVECEDPRGVVMLTDAGLTPA